MNMATDTHEVTDTRIAVIKEQSGRLIQSTIKTHNERVSLEEAIRDGVANGLTVDGASDASGLNAEEVERIALSTGQERWDQPDSEILFGSV